MCLPTLGEHTGSPLQLGIPHEFSKNQSFLPPLIPPYHWGLAGVSDYPTR